MPCLGLTGVLAYSVSQRTHEIGVRMALGAERRDVLRLVLKHGVVLVLIGVGIGLIGAVSLTPLPGQPLVRGYRHRLSDVFVGVSLLLTAVFVLASYIPARRATRVDPMVALRHE